ncbi:hypothetical protein FACS1894174_00250 [Bacteroidia bacterium]|nr:hypothetical protein FACS1894203_1690 [Bacteroidia bacterium]GHV19750.1 hypothetical protein FACS1894174_00250 [Bacteroidia bacterium]
MNSAGQYIGSLIKKGGHKQSKIARAIGLPEGKLLKMQTENSIHNYKQQLENELAGNLLKANAFWSYANMSAENIPDEELIEKTFIYLDLRDIARLFELYPRNYIRKVWRENMAIQGDYLFNLNVMIALYYFDIRQPEKYLKNVEQEHIKHLLDHA